MRSNMPFTTQKPWHVNVAVMKPKQSLEVNRIKRPQRLLPCRWKCWQDAIEMPAVRCNLRRFGSDKSQKAINLCPKGDKMIPSIRYYYTQVHDQSLENARVPSQNLVISTWIRKRDRGNCLSMIFFWICGTSGPELVSCLFLPLISNPCIHARRCWQKPFPPPIK